jgi:D-alanyl-D-alanine carboxypeptidase
MKKYLTIILIILSFLSFELTYAGNKKTRLYNEVKNIILKEINTYGIPGIQVCISSSSFENDVKISEGVLNIETGERLTDQTQIKVGSITKSFTGIGILLLIKKGLINIDDPISKYLQVNDKKYSGIKIKELLNMHSGLRGYINDDSDSCDYIINTMIADPDHNYKPIELVKYGFKLTEDLGVTGQDEFHYTNTNYILLGMIIESVSQMSYAEFIRKEITEPFGLDNTYFSTDNDYNSNVSNGYHLDKEENTTEDYSRLNLSYVGSAGAIISTASDLCKWVTSIGTGKIPLGEASKYIYEGLPAANSAYYTSGLLNENNKLWHNGTVLGYHGVMCFLKESKTAIVVLSNCTISGIEVDPVAEVMDAIIEIITKN